MFCENCGKNISDMATVCPHCGQLTGATPALISAPAAPRQHPARALHFFRPVLEALDQGNVIRTAVVFALRAFGVLTLLGGLFLLIEILKVSFQLPTQGTIGGLLFAIIFVVAIASLFQIFFYRAQSVRDLGESPFTVIPIFSILFRMIGETNAVFAVAAGVGGCLFIWLSGMSPLRFLPGIGELLPSVSGGTFLEGLLFLVWAAVLSFVFLVGFYFLAEAIVVVVDIARNIRLLVQGGVTGGKGSGKVAA
jgi:hypothetical protein